MFTALVISRLLINALYAVGVRNEKLYGKRKERAPIHFLQKRKIFFTISIILILSGPVGMIAYNAATGSPLNYSLEFQGGTSTNVTFNEELSMDEIDAKVIPVVEEITGDANVQATKVVDSSQVIIKTSTLDVSQREALEQAMVDDFGVDADKITSESISSTVSGEMRRDAVLSVVVAAVMMLFYIWFRFKDIRFASSAVLALLHDVLIVFAFYVLARVSVGNTFIACMLTILGYSINATIVIFDRIRENLKSTKVKTDQELETLVNASITPDPDQKYLHFTDHFYQYLYAVPAGSIFHSGIRPASYGRYCLRRIFFCLPDRCYVVCDENKIEKSKEIKKRGCRMEVKCGGLLSIHTEEKQLWKNGWCLPKRRIFRKSGENLAWIR